MTGQDVIDYIVENNLQNAIVSVTATIYTQGDHMCITTEDVELYAGHKYDRAEQKDIDTIDFYVDDNLQHSY